MVELAKRRASGLRKRRSQGSITFSPVRMANKERCENTQMGLCSLSMGLTEFHGVQYNLGKHILANHTRPREEFVHALLFNTAAEIIMMSYNQHTYRWPTRRILKILNVLKHHSRAKLHGRILGFFHSNKHLCTEAQFSWGWSWMGRGLLPPPHDFPKPNWVPMH